MSWSRCSGLAQIADRRAQGFSQGEKMKTAIARALVHDPDTILLDEPTNGLDIMSVRSLREQLQGTARRRQVPAVQLARHAGGGGAVRPHRDPRQGAQQYERTRYAVAARRIAPGVMSV